MNLCPGSWFCRSRLDLLCSAKETTFCSSQEVTARKHIAVFGWTAERQNLQHFTPCFPVRNDHGFKSESVAQLQERHALSKHGYFKIEVNPKCSQDHISICYFAHLNSKFSKSKQPTSLGYFFGLQSMPSVNHETHEQSIFSSRWYGEIYSPLVVPGRKVSCGFFSRITINVSFVKTQMRLQTGLLLCTDFYEPRKKTSLTGFWWLWSNRFRPGMRLGALFTKMYWVNQDLVSSPGRKLTIPAHSNLSTTRDLCWCARDDTKRSLAKLT